MQASDLTGGVYYACHQCKEGKYSDADIAIGSGEPLSKSIQEFIEHHLNHNENVPELIIATIFLSQYLADGYIDVDRPDLEPLILKIPGGDGHEVKTGLQPVGAAGATEIQRIMRHQHSGHPGDIRRPTFEARQPTLKDMQVTLPWTVKYSQDYRMNPESHKDFRHALTHVAKALGKLFAIVDDFDHRRTSDMDHKVKDYLADLVICAMRAANTHPGGIIDLMQAVQDRVKDKNFDNVKVVEDSNPE